MKHHLFSTHIHIYIKRSSTQSLIEQDEEFMKVVNSIESNSCKRETAIRDTVMQKRKIRKRRKVREKLENCAEIMVSN